MTTTTDDVSGLEKKFSMPNAFCFTEELLDRCKQHSRPLQDLLPEYKDAELKLIPLKDIWGIEHLHNKVTLEQRPQAFQTRVNETVDSKTCDEIENDIRNKRWNPYELQGIVAPCSPNWVNNNGQTKKYRIVNLTHRWTAAGRAGEEYIIAWVADIPEDRVRKIANKILNNDYTASNRRDDDDVVASVIEDYLIEGRPLNLKIKAADKSEYNDIVILELMDYGLTKTKAKGYVGRVIINTDLIPERRFYKKSSDLHDHIKLNFPLWTPSDSKDDTCDYYDGPHIKYTNYIAFGGNMSGLIKKVIAHYDAGWKGTYNIISALSPDRKIKPEDAAKERANEYLKFVNFLRSCYELYKALFIDRSLPLPSWLYSSEFAGEKEPISHHYDT